MLVPRVLQPLRHTYGITSKRCWSVVTGNRSSRTSNCCIFPDVEMIAANHRRNNNSSSRRTKSSASTTAMKDEYDTMDDSGDTYTVQNYELENGSVLPFADLRYQTYGQLNADRSNVLVVCHALTGNASLHSWWKALLETLDTSKHFVVCCNILGSCYGSTNPTSIHPETGNPYGMDFPDVSVQDTVRLQLRMLQEHLQVSSIKSVIGGSFGGMQAVEYAIQGGSGGGYSKDDGQNYVRSVIPIACGAQHTAWQIGISEVQRQCIYRDAAWQAGDYANATNGLQLARQIGMISYRTPAGYVNKFGRDIAVEDHNDTTVSYGRYAEWKVKRYLEYQGEKFLKRFDPITYVKLTEQMDSHDVTRNRPGTTVADALAVATMPALVMGIDSDILYPLVEQKALADAMPNAQLKIIHSEEGHDGFLLEQDQVGSYIDEFLSTID